MKNKYSLLIMMLFFTFSFIQIFSQTVWTGSTITFTKTDGADYTLPENQDVITDNVIITRANTRGLFNITIETIAQFGQSSLSPIDTEWAAGTTANYDTLIYDTFIKTSNYSPASMIGNNYVLHLITDDVYIDIQLESWANGSSGGQGGFSYTRSTPNVPLNDLCDSAETLTVYDIDASTGNEIAGDTTSATSSPIAITSCDVVPTNYDLFYEFTVPTGETGVVVYTSGETGNQIETVLLDSCGGSEIVGSCQANGTTHLFDGLIEDQTYILQVWHDLSEFSDNRGTFNIAVELIPPTPTNDLCANPVNLIVGTSNTENIVIGNNINTTDSGEITPTCANYAGGDLWYSAVVPTSGELIIETLEANGFPDGGLAVYSGTCGSLTQLDCDDDDGQGRMSKIVLAGQTIGEIILIRVWDLDNNRIGKFGVVAYDPNAALVSELETFNFQYYPNPILNELHLTANERITNVVIYNLLGQEVKQNKISSLKSTINTTNLSKGTYFIKVTIKDKTGVFKIIKK